MQAALSSQRSFNPPIRRLGALLGVARYVILFSRRDARDTDVASKTATLEKACPKSASSNRRPVNAVRLPLTPAAPRPGRFNPVFQKRNAVGDPPT